ncbi:MAG: hypothetical protein MUC29_08355 [Pyrinomonadaceae bacterium]|nr:hypothetical protein [Pyrinomonadaceae bacterium]
MYRTELVGSIIELNGFQIKDKWEGTDLGSNSSKTNELIKFYNPRIDIWGEHFKLNDNGQFEFLTEKGEVTARIFKFNNFERILERKGLIELGLM